MKFTEFGGLFESFRKYTKEKKKLNETAFENIKWLDSMGLLQTFRDFIDKASEFEFPKTSGTDIEVEADEMISDLRQRYDRAFKSITQNPEILQKAGIKSVDEWKKKWADIAATRWIPDKIEKITKLSLRPDAPKLRNLGEEELEGRISNFKMPSPEMKEMSAAEERRIAEKSRLRNVIAQDRAADKGGNPTISMPTALDVQDVDFENSQDAELPSKTKYEKPDKEEKKKTMKQRLPQTF